jgi:hypothetical protein
MRRRLSVLLLVLACAIPAGAVAAAPAAHQSSGRVPQGFVGMNLDGPFFNGRIDVAQQFNTIVASGVESVRVAFDWSAAQPYPSFTALKAAGANPSGYEDVGGVPTTFTSTDAVVAQAAERHLQVLPVVLYAPSWDAAKHKPFPTIERPANPAPYARYLKALVQRYGPDGSYWSEHPSTPKVPIRMWQIWNEPDIPSFWPTRPWPKDYVTLLRAAHAAIKQADPGAKVVLAGLPNYSWLYLKAIYKVPGARSAFDVVAIHPYTAQPAGVITILRLARGVMDAAGDAHKPIIASEVGWPSALGSAMHSFNTTEDGQARDVSAVLPLLAANRVRLGLLGFDFYSWVGAERKGAPAFDFSGLFRYNAQTGHVVPKPAWPAFRRGALALEGCGAKGALATVCVKRGS